MLRRWPRLLQSLCPIAFAVSSAPTQAPRTGPYEFGLSLTLQNPPDVNRPPRCQSLGLPCTSARTFPDFGAGLAATLVLRERVGLAAEVGGFANAWRSSSAADGQEMNQVQFAVAGPSVRSRLLQYGTVRPRYVRTFAQVMGGVLSSTLGAASGVVQAGLGADGLLDRTLWIRFQFDYRIAISGSRNLSGGRALVAFMAKP